MKALSLHLDDIPVQVGALCLLMMLSMDVLNPIKAICSFLGISPSVCGWISWIALLGVLYNNLSDVLYFCIKVFLNSILSIFFKSIEIVGKDNIPMDGPVIFTGNHANQFVDGMIVMMNCYRKVGFLIAEKSSHLPVVGTLSKAMGCIPVVRPQDAVINGTGRVKMDPTSSETTFILQGIDTIFTSQVKVGDQIRFQGETVLESGTPIKVESITDDTHLVLSRTLLDSLQKPIVEPCKYGIFQKVDQSHTFGEVYSHLKRGNCIGIFPEGGSHDRTDLLPLKAGVAIMAFGVQDKYHINVPVVPVGLNYFRGHRFRGRVVIEFGSPILIKSEDMTLYKSNKRKACNMFLHRVEEGMRSVIVTAPDYHILQIIYTGRRLYQKNGIRLSTKETQDLNRRFAEGYKLLSSLDENETVKQDLHKLRHQLEEYRKSLALMGLSDHQVPFIAWWSLHDIVSSFVYSITIFALASIPTFVLNAPVGLMARYVAKIEQKKALKGSKVKIAGRDVLLSKKISFSMVAVPVLWAFYVIMAILLTDWYWSSIFLLTTSLPLFSYFGVRSVEAGIIELKTIRPLFYRMQFKYRKIQDELPQRRAYLQMEVRKFVKKYEQELGPLAQTGKIDWNNYMHSVAIVENEGGEGAENSTEANGNDHASKASSTTSGNDQGSSPSTIAPVGSSGNVVQTRETHCDSITKEHDLSFLIGVKTKSMIDLDKLEHEASMHQLREVNGIDDEPKKSK